MSEAMLANVAWTPTGLVAEGDEPFATHEGTVDIFGLTLRCYRLSTGQAVIQAEDMHKLLDTVFADSATIEGKSEAVQA